MKRSKSGIGSGAGSWFVNERECPHIQIHTKMLRIWNTCGTIFTYGMLYERDLFCTIKTFFSAMQPRKRQYHDGESTMCTAPFRKGIIPSHPCCWPHNFLAVVIIGVHEVSGVADPDPGCGIRCLFDPSIRDSNPESGMVKKSGSGIRDGHPR